MILNYDQYPCQLSFIRIPEGLPTSRFSEVVSINRKSVSLEFIQWSDGNTGKPQQKKHRDKFGPYQTSMTEYFAKI